MLMLACAKKVRLLDATLRKEGWFASKALLSPMGALHGETAGLIAFGNIARAMAKRCQVLGMTVIASDPFIAPETFAEAGVESVSLEELAERSDYVSCHLPLGPKTRGFVDASFFNRMKPSAYFINTSRGAVVKEADLIAALQEGRIAGAGLDVTAPEPLPDDSSLWDAPNVILSQHTSGSSPFNADRITTVFLDNLGRYLQGEPLVNVVDPVLGY